MYNKNVHAYITAPFPFSLNSFYTPKLRHGPPLVLHGFYSTSTIIFLNTSADSSSPAVFYYYNAFRACTLII